MSPISDAIVYASTQPIPGDRHQQRHVAVVGAERAQFLLDPADLAVELIDHRDGSEHVGTPRLRKLQLLEDHRSDRLHLNLDS